MPTSSQRRPERDDSHDDTLQLTKLSMPQPVRVLIVEDDELVRDHLAAVVAGAGFAVVTAANGRDALEVQEHEFCSIVLSDFNMPEMNGPAFCRALRGRDYPGYVYTILLTVMDNEQDILAGLEAGADDYLSKRVSSAQLIARLRTAQRIVSLEQQLRIVLEEKRREAMTDSLTGVYNRTYFTRHFAREIKRTQRFGGDLAVVAMDIDHFKSVNDRFGHGVGDEVLRGFVRIVAAHLPRNYDWLARVGGEEFMVVLPQTDVTGASVVAEKLRAAVAATPVPTSAGELPITMSVGVSTLKLLPADETLSAEALIELADRYLYKSKAHGRNRVSAPPLHPHSPHSRG